MKKIFSRADILLPDFTKVNGETWAVIACDQFTSEPKYWDAVKEKVGDAPSTLKMVLPEIYLSDSGKDTIDRINRDMSEIASTLVSHPDSMIYLERIQSDGKLRRGIIGKIDLECYDYSVGSDSAVRATEGTVLERIPPRVAVRRDAEVELPHVMILIDDEENALFGKIINDADKYSLAYDFDLMLGSGHVKGRFIDSEGMDHVENTLSLLSRPEVFEKKYLLSGYSPLTYAVGDGNHSLASAKAAYAEIKEKLGDKALEHPSRYALCEIVNLHDTALEFEPIYRVMFGVEPEKIVEELRAYATEASAAADSTDIRETIECVYGGNSKTVTFERSPHRLTVGSLQLFIDGYLKEHPEASVDYIHGVDSTLELSGGENAIGFLFDGMRKDELFASVICEGALPRKTFSMGEAKDKRFYLECRKIK